MAKKLLLIENDKNVLACSRMLFQHYGFEVDCAETMGSSRELVSRNAYDVIVAELCLENGDENQGLKMIEHIKDISPDTKIIVVTYLCDRTVRKKALTYDIHGYFEKPVSFDKILKLIETI